jgi:hypothetical protein
MSTPVDDTFCCRDDNQQDYGNGVNCEICLDELEHFAFPGRLRCRPLPAYEDYRREM